MRDEFTEEYLLDEEDVPESDTPEDTDDEDDEEAEVGGPDEEEM
jgi:hypothetical protein